MRILHLIAALQATHIEPDRLPPIDECGDDSSFVEYRRSLANAIERKDVAALRPLVASTIRFSFGLEEGWPRFFREWDLDRPADSGLWAELAEVLALGCEVSEGARIMPGNLVRLADYDEPLVYFATKTGAALRSRPNESAPLMMALDNHVLIDVGVAPEGWLWVRLTNGLTGFVRTAEVRSAMDYRAWFEKLDGRWAMTGFVAGE